MNATNLFTDDDAVSPVIGVILMVAVTVILATVIASAVLGLGQTRSATMPQASLSVSVTDGDNVTVAHDGGDSIAIERVSVTTTGSASTIPPGSALADSELTSGDRWVAATGVSDGEVVRIVYESPDTDQSAILGTLEA
ncbi:type IV pilin N-terminal domain-containing protein [Haloarcula pelagica]|uniref:type IV pilin N-terminal domain-containing protein n=1 Tax=Haloarcula pelagica TaxID=3033389 RepID=UPI0024C39090|nr:type IV pilin N-terminal domain-containing protein [Halomicroarcula sp. YJ-61-S]